MMILSCNAEAGRMAAAHAWRPATLTAAVLDRLRHGVAVLDEAGMIIYRNDAFESIVRRGGGLRLVAGRPHASTSSDDARLQAAVANCARRRADPRAPSDISLWGRRGEHSLVVSVLPVGSGDGLSALEEAPAVLLLVVDTEPTVALDERFLRAAFHFTEAEAFLARRLLEGATLAEFAVDKGVTIHTARSQLKSLMQKAGVSRQSELINLLSRCDAIRRTAA